MVLSALFAYPFTLMFADSVVPQSLHVEGQGFRSADFPFLMFRKMTFSSGGNSMSLTLSDRKFSSGRVIVFSDIPSFNVKFLDYGSAVLLDTFLLKGEKPECTVEIPVKPQTAQWNYRFKGWKPELSIVNRNAVYKALLDSSLVVYRIDFVNFDGDSLQSDSIEYGSLPVYRGEVPVKPSTVMYDYVFREWSPAVGAVVRDSVYTATYDSSLVNYTLSLAAVDSLYGDVTGSGDYPYGTDVEIRALRNRRGAFMGWEDGVKDSVRTVTVVSDSVLTALFASQNPDNFRACDSVASVNKFDWLLMMDRRSLTSLGYSFEDGDVAWYRVVGELDDLNYPDLCDDERLCGGLYLTGESTLSGSGSYYALVTLAEQEDGVACYGTLRTPVFRPGHQEPDVVLSPTVVSAGSMLSLTQIPLHETVGVSVFSSDGLQVDSLSFQGSSSVCFRAQSVPGEYIVKVYSKSVDKTFKYIVTVK